MKKVHLEDLLLFLSAGLFMFFAVQILAQTGLSWFIDFKVASSWGTTIAGGFSFVSILLLYVTLKHQSSAFRVSQFENKYFEQIRYHRDNVASFEYQSPETTDKNKPKTKSGYGVFVDIHREVMKASDLFHEFLKKGDIKEVFLNSEEYEKEASYSALAERNIDIVDLTKFNVSYLIVFYGLSSQGKAILARSLCSKYDELWVEHILDTFWSIPVLWSKYRDEFENGAQIPSSAKFFKYFGGHQHRLGHYFRNLYQTIKYIDKNEMFRYDEKYEYVKRVRAQFSTYEQSVLFFNSISIVGRIWELDQKSENDQLITKYNLIKNIPADFITDVRVEDYYPLVEYEGSSPPEKRAELKKKYL
jgi:hypothetical protein